MRACDGIGRHARFRYSCSDACGFESLQAHHVGASVISLAPTSFISKLEQNYFAVSSLQAATDALEFSLIVGVSLYASIFFGKYV